MKLNAVLAERSTAFTDCVFNNLASFHKARWGDRPAVRSMSTELTENSLTRATRFPSPRDGRRTLTIAAQHIKRMRGGAQSHLMRCDDGYYYVVKFRNNPQHERVLANEFLATRLAELVGLPVSVAKVVEVPPWLVEHTSELTILLGSHAIQVEAGLQFGSRYVVSPVEGQVFDYPVSYTHLERFASVGLILEFWWQPLRSTIPGISSSRLHSGGAKPIWCGE